MKIGIYLPYVGITLGGAEQSGAKLASALREDHEVEIVHHESLCVEQLAVFAGVELGGVRARRVPGDRFTAGSRNPFKRLKEVIELDAVVSAPYDVFVAFVISAPPFCHAPKGLLRVVFPFGKKPGTGARASRGRDFLRGPRRAYYAWEWRRRLAGYQTRVANSEFTRAWTKRRWGIDCEVVYPPGDASIRPQPKKNLILSVGRFFMLGHQKRQLEMVLSFQQMLESASSAGWEYVCAGGLNEADAQARAYFDGVTQAARGESVHVLANVPRDRLRALYGEAKIFWHAAGLGQDEDVAPERCEHFGTVTVEAMAAACVPVVIRKGGQPEIVEHGVSGFLWNTVDELEAYTRLLMDNGELRQRMSVAAVVRAQRFSRATFENQMLRRLKL